MRKSTTIENCKVFLTPAQVNALSSALALKLVELRGREVQKKEWLARYREENKVLSEDIRAMSRAIIDGYELHEMECELQYDFDEGIVNAIRTDTGECVNTRPITDEERQEDIDD